MLRRALLALAATLYVLCAGATTHVNDGGTWRQLTEVHVNDAGTWRTIQEVYVNDAGTWRSVFVFFSADAGADINTTSNPVGRTCSVVGGTGPFTYAWARISGDTRITASPTNTASTQFSRTGFALCEVASATFQCTVTDTSNGLTAQDTVGVIMERPC